MKRDPHNKLKLHPRNPHRARYDFELLTDSCSALTSFIRKNPRGHSTIDFSDPEAVKALNQALLSHFYGIVFWDIPENFLCPAVPGRADYIHYLADLLAQSNDGNIPRGKKVKVLDIGVGASCIYPIIGYKEYGWQFVGVDVNPLAVSTASEIIKANSSLKRAISLRQQTEVLHIFEGIWRSDERFDVTLCNPPFHRSEQAMEKENQRKRKGLSKTKVEADEKEHLNFGGHQPELWCEGGEEGFIQRMIRESVSYGDKCFWFTCLVSRQSHLKALQQVLKDVGVRQTHIIEMAQGQKISRFLAWSFLDESQRDYWRYHYWQQ